MSQKIMIYATFMFAIIMVYNTIYSINYIDAYHYSNRRWQSTTVDLCYDTYSLSYLRIDGTTNQVNKAISQLDIARGDWNNQPSRFTLNRISGQYCTNWIYAANIANSNEEYTAATVMLCVREGSGERCAILDIPPDFPTGYITRASVTFNTSFNWFTTQKCPSDLTIKDRTLNYVARHEFGHWISFNHTYGSPSSSVMYYNYNCNSRNFVKPDDSSELSSIYG
ncbi:MAG: matrixin family metalloprotease [Candidatus Nitrosocaldus sp.]